MKIIFLLLVALFMLSFVSTQTASSGTTTTTAGSGSGTTTTTGSGSGSTTSTGSGSGTTTTGSGSGSTTSTGSGSGITITCPINYRLNPQNVCIPVQQCCLDPNCKPLYIANPTYKTKVKKNSSSICSI